MPEALAGLQPFVLRAILNGVSGSIVGWCAAFALGASTLIGVVIGYLANELIGTFVVSRFVDEHGAPGGASDQSPGDSPSSKPLTQWGWDVELFPLQFGLAVLSIGTLTAVFANPHGMFWTSLESAAQFAWLIVLAACGAGYVYCVSRDFILSFRDEDYYWFASSVIAFIGDLFLLKLIGVVHDLDLPGETTEMKAYIWTAGVPALMALFCASWNPVRLARRLAKRRGYRPDVLEWDY